MAKLGGCFSGGKIKFETVGIDSIKISVKSDNYISFSRLKIELDKSKPSYGARVIQLKKIRGIPKSAESAKRQGTALNRITTMIREGKNLGINYIIGDFIKTNNGHDGYLKYARLGFDGKISPRLASEIKNKFPQFNYGNVKTVQKFIKTYGLKNWEDFGGGFEGSFDLTNKEQLKILVSYIRKLKK